MGLKSKRDRLLFRTHEPPFQKPGWEVGQFVDLDGKVHRITRWVRLRPVLLERGGSVGEWEVWGRAVSDKELREAVAEAADKLLGSE